MPASLPRTTKALVLQKTTTGRPPVLYDAVVQEQPILALKPGEVLVKIGAVSFNRRDFWMRRGLYPRIIDGSTFGSDGSGTVIASADPADPLLARRVFLTPMRGWESDPTGPESEFGILGGGSVPPIGTLTEYVVVPRREVIPTPAHVSDEQIAAWPLGGLTAWRAIALAQISRGDTVLITGIGGGVAILALQICVAMGAVVYVTSGSQQKIDKAVKLGAMGGVRYTEVIDSGGDEIMGKISKYLRAGGRVVCYGMTAGPTISMTMREVMRGQQLIGTLMGSRADMVDATNFLAEHKIVPVVAAVLHGFAAAEDGFKMMEKGSQFGKIVLKLGEASVKANL
ncbi:hypothetical protein C8F04DRAFT_1221926 [Mycena alexandri]|uniref:Enoyl reductase (ER) domain-containing protein n=1 Tax=Mycena alexandri TaxID=1745969 RepID=A0AAD6X0P4_9AGAR|nr:hypothetical protein C8F04DRAFT_1221926 [Mycena alexandri]